MPWRAAARVCAVRTSSDITWRLGWRRTTSAMASISLALKTLPVGLCGELSTKSLLRGVICSARGQISANAWRPLWPDASASGPKVQAYQVLLAVLGLLTLTDRGLQPTD